MKITEFSRDEVHEVLPYFHLKSVNFSSSAVTRPAKWPMRDVCCLAEVDHRRNAPCGLSHLAAALHSGEM